MKVKVMRTLSIVAAAALVAIASAGCNYIVPPLEIGSPTTYIVDSGWAGIVTNVTDSGGALHVDLSIVNSTNQWSAMDVSSSKAQVVDSGGGGHDCGKVFVGTAVFVDSGGTYIPPGFVMKAYTGGSVAKPETQPLYVECSGVAKASGQKLSISYEYITGDFNYYRATRPISKSMTLDLDKVVTDTTYPVAHKVASLKVNKPGDVLPAINGCTIALAAVRRTDQGLEFDWATTNPTDAKAYIHIGTPPVIGSDGILYGFYRAPSLPPDPPVTKAGGQAAWTTTVTAPKDVTGFYLLVPVENHQEKYFIDQLIDITTA
jgi:hypothetical protein